MDISKLKVFVNNTLYEVLAKIDKNGKGVAFVCDENDLFCGIITDGDARRYLLGGGLISDRAELVMNKTPYVIYEGCMDTNHAYKILEEKSLASIPVLSEEGKVVNAFSKDDVKEMKRRIDVPVVIMAGGKGTRLKPYTNILPKPLIPIGEKTITEHIIEMFMNNGCSRFTLIINYKKKLIKTFLSYFDKNVDIDFVEENDFNGTAGGLKLLKGKIDETFILSNCDIIIDDEYYSYLEYHRKEKNLITVVSVRMNFQLPYGVIENDERMQIKGVEEKPKYSFLTNSGFYIIEPEFIDLIPSNKIVHMTDMIEYAIDNNYRVGAYEIKEEKWSDMGQINSLERMRERYE